jgi:hypothetical protein
MRDQYREDLQMLMQYVVPGDTVSVDVVSDNPLARTRWPSWTLPKCGAMEAAERCRAKGQRITDDLRDHIDALLDEETAGSAIVETILAAAKRPLAGPECSQRMLFVFSDAVEESEHHDFPEMELTEESIDQVLAELGQLRLLPDLAGVQLWFAGATAVNGDKKTESLATIQGIERFWQSYASAAGADLRCYDTRLRTECVIGTARQASASH